MKIGLIDYDLYMEPKKKRFNVEVMKLGTYYEEKGHQVEVLSPANIIFDYDKIIVVASFTLNKILKTKFLQHPNITFVGPGVNNGFYLPFENDEINYAKPQFKFYNNLLKYYYKKGIYSKTDIEKLKEMTVIRVYPNKTSIDINNILTGGKIYITDNYIYNYPDWEKTIQYLAIYNRYFSFVFPQIIQNKEDLIKFYKLFKYNFLSVRAIIKIQSLEKTIELLKEGKDIFNEIPPTTFIWEIGYNENNNYNEKFYEQSFYENLLKVEKFYEHEVKIHEAAYADHTEFEFTAAMFNVLKGWMRTRINTKYSFNEYIFLQLNHKTRLISLYLNFIDKHPKYKPLINKIYEGGKKYVRK